MRRAVEPSRGSLARGEEPGTCPGSWLLGGGVNADEYHGFAQLLHALDHVCGAWRLAVPKRDEHVAGLGHLVVTAHACGLPEARPLRAEELVFHCVLPRPAVAELVGAPGAAGDDLRDAVAIRRQHLAQALIIRERA